MLAISANGIAIYIIFIGVYIYNLNVFVDTQVVYIRRCIPIAYSITQKHDLSKNSKHNKNEVKYKRGFEGNTTFSTLEP